VLVVRQVADRVADRKEAPDAEVQGTLSQRVARLVIGDLGESKPRLSGGRRVFREGLLDERRLADVVPIGLRTQHRVDGLGCCHYRVVEMIRCQLLSRCFQDDRVQSLDRGCRQLGRRTIAPHRLSDDEATVPCEPSLAG
jgi:hypothetical protein